MPASLNNQRASLKSSLLNLTSVDLSVDDKEFNFDPELLKMQSTCSEDYESNPDYVKCYSCSSKNDLNCNLKPDLNYTTSDLWCNIKKKKCFSKAIYKAPNNVLQSFNRGCATVDELVGLNVPIRNFSKGFCFKNQNSTKSCVILCDSMFCNREVTGRASRVRVGPIRQVRSANKKENDIFSMLLSFYSLFF